MRAPKKKLEDTQYYSIKEVAAELSMAREVVKVVLKKHYGENYTYMPTEKNITRRMISTIISQFKQPLNGRR